MKARILIFFLITLIFAITIFIVYALFQLKSNPKTSNSIQDSPSYNRHPSSYPTEQPIQEIQTITYQHPSGNFQYSYPESWTFIKGREGIGLVPNEVKVEGKWSGEIVTIFSIETNLDLIDWVHQYDGSGYEIEKSININDYPGYYIYKQSDLLAMHIYAFKKDNLIVRINFRQRDSGSGLGKWDFSKYLNDFEKIVYSIKYTTNRGS